MRADRTRSLTGVAAEIVGIEERRARTRKAAVALERRDGSWCRRKGRLGLLGEADN